MHCTRVGLDAVAGIAMLALIGCTDGPTASSRDVASHMNSTLQASGVRSELRSNNAGAPTNVFNQHFPVTYTTFACGTGEPIEVSGTAHVLTVVWNDDPDNIRIRGTTNMNLAGVGLSSGLKYRVQQVVSSTFEFDWVTGVGEVSQVFHFNIISATSAPNLRMTMNVTYIFDGKGGVVLVPKKWETICD
jgi:hypothetical protein